VQTLKAVCVDSQSYRHEQPRFSRMEARIDRLEAELRENYFLPDPAGYRR
jgi:hypothetical protein